MLPSRLFLVGVLSLLSLLRPLAQAPASDETARINAWFEAKFEEQLAFSPIQQTFLGRKSGELDDMSIAAQDKVLAWQRAVGGRDAQVVRLHEAEP